MFDLKKNQLIQLLLIVGVAIILLLLIKTYYFDNKSTHTQGSREGFYDYDADSPVAQPMADEEEMEESAEEVQEQFENPPPSASEAMGMNETNRPLNETGDVSNLGQFLPSECYPKDVLSSSDLLPGGANSTWAQVVPAGQGALTDQNFLTAGHHLGMNTVGNSLRNASWDLRSEIPNPQAQVSPWNQTTIGPDLMRRPLDCP
jgi:hypothetical protein